MGELFDRMRPVSKLEWTGERLTTDVQGQVEVEHLHRYFLAREFCRGLDVLDIASGEGYGSALLAQTAQSVVGVEVDPRVVDHARQAYVLDNLRFEQGDARSIPLADHSVDCVISFETIEHFFDQEKFLAEVKRVLRPDGFLIISSPDRDFYSPESGPSNPYHIRELTRSEFHNLIRSHFSNSILYGQRPIVGSVIIPDRDEGDQPRTLSFERRNEERFEASAGLSRTLYWIAIASNSPLPRVVNSLYFEKAEVDGIVQLPLLRQRLASSQGELEAARETVSGFQNEVERLVSGFDAERANDQREASETLRIVREERDHHLHNVKSLQVHLAKLNTEVEQLTSTIVAERKKSSDELANFAEQERIKLASALDAHHLEIERLKQTFEAEGANDQREAAENLRIVREERDHHLHNIETLQVQLAKLDTEVEQLTSTIVAERKKSSDELANFAEQEGIKLASALDAHHLEIEQLKQTFEAERANDQRETSIELRDVQEDSDQHLRNVSILLAHLRKLDIEIERNRARIQDQEAMLQVRDRQIADMQATFWWKAYKITDRVGSFLRLKEGDNREGGAAPSHDEASTAVGIPEISEQANVPLLVLPAPGASPDVSVVILSYGQVDYTIKCLAAIAKHPPCCSIEVIVSDDCSGAADLDKIAGIVNVILRQPPHNLGFLKHANDAVSHSTGRYVLLLNNDTEPQVGAIDALFNLAEATPGVGLVGSKLVYPDGRLQEAGGIVWDDAAAWNYGRLDNPEKPEFNYVRDADYISGASILISRKVWDDLGGFDESYAPAYYEDTDLAFRLRVAGLRVLYQPASVVVHHEGISHGTDVTSGIKAHQVENQRIFRERWSATLQSQNYPNGAHVMRARDRAKGRPTILIIDHYVPEPDRDAGSRNIIEMIKSLQADGWVIKFWPHNLNFHTVYTTSLQQTGVEVFYTPWQTSFEDWFFQNANEIDFILLSRPTVAPNFLPVVKRWSSAPIVFYGHDLHSERMRLQAEVQIAEMRREADLMEEAERSIWRDVDVVLYPSQVEADAVARLEPDVVARPIIPFCFDEFRTLRAPPKSMDILFVAGFAHPPNIDAVVWLATKILPIVRDSIPEARLWVVGSNPVEAVKNLANDHIEVTGQVSAAELLSRYQAARVAVVPLRIGAGVKLKVVEALHEGLPLVTTQIGAQGLVGVEQAAIVREEAKDIADEIVRLLQDDAAWTLQAQAQLDYAQKSFSRRSSIESLQLAFELAVKRASTTRSWSPGNAIGRNLTDRQYLETLAFDETFADGDFIDRVYIRLLRRHPDPGGFETYSRDLSNKRLSRIELIEEIENSDEYKSRIRQ
jgi:GT2 family glycosyltransferase/SAM-dependent methyltransferase/glycosyltransferase involved in cell wall biosynthesis